MNRTIRAVLAAISLMFLAIIVVMPMIAHAQQTLPTMCGAPAFGKQPDGTKWPDSGPPRGAPGQYVREDGFWSYCPAWVDPVGGDPRTPDPALTAPCQANQYSAEIWFGSDGSTCDSTPPGTVLSNSHRRPLTPHGGIVRLWDDYGNEQGMRVYRCVVGTWVVVMDECHYVIKPPAEKPPKSFGGPRLTVKPRVP